PVRLDGSAQARLVVHEDVMVRREAGLDVSKPQLLVDVDQDVSLDRLEQARVLHLERLEHDVAVREDGGRSPGPRVLDGVQRAWEEPVGERVAQQEGGDGEQVRPVRILDAEPLQGAEVVGVPQLLAQLLEQLPVPLLLLVAYGAPEVAAHVDDDAVVVEQRVVDVEERDHRGARHRGALQHSPRPGATPLRPFSGDQVVRPQKRAALVHTILRRSSSGRLPNSESITRREYGQSLPWWGKSVDHAMLSTPTWCRTLTPLRSTMKVASQGSRK